MLPTAKGVQLTTKRRAEQAFGDDVLAEADAYAKVRAEALRRAYDTVNDERRRAMLEIAEFCDRQEKSTLNRGRRSQGAGSNSGNRVRSDEG